MSKQLHFWFSKEGQIKATRNRVALINGKEVVCTASAASGHIMTIFDDTEYLGKGIVSRINGVIQQDAIPAMLEAGIDVEGY